MSCRRAHRSSPRAMLLPCTLVVLAWAAPAAAAAGSHAHQHGLVRIDLAIEAGSVTVLLEAPLDSLLGFERPPRNAAERAQAEAMLARLRRTDAPLLAFEAAAACTLASAQAQSQTLQPGAPAGEHAELEASFTFTCRQGGAAIRQIDVAALLQAFARIARIELQVAGPAGQYRQVLTRPATVLRWGR